MALRQQLLVMAALLTMVVDGTSFCPVPAPWPCECTNAFGTSHHLQKIDCSSKGLTVIPDLSALQGQPIFQVDLSNNDISFVRDNAFDGLDFFSYNIAYHPKIKLHDNPIEGFDDDAFLGITADLFELILSNSSIDEYPAMAISQIQNLSTLYIGDNSITIIPPNSFVEFSKLRTLLLDGNPLGELEENVFQGLEETLEYLYLRRTELVEFPSQAIKGLHELQYLQLDGNTLGDLYESLFEGFDERSTAMFLDLTNCGIHNITAAALADHGVKVRSLILTHNDLTQVDFLQSVCESALKEYAEIVVEDNPIECTCETLSMLKQLPSTMAVRGHCAGPSPFTDMDLYTLIHFDDEHVVQQGCPHLYDNNRFINPEIDCDRDVSRATGLHFVRASLCHMFLIMAYLVL